MELDRGNLDTLFSESSLSFKRSTARSQRFFLEFSEVKNLRDGWLNEGRTEGLSLLEADALLPMNMSKGPITDNCFGNMDLRR